VLREAFLKEGIEPNDEEDVTVVYENMQAFMESRKDLNSESAEEKESNDSNSGATEEKEAR
jgi:uncharacterized protein (DUF302 family)